MQTKKVAKLSTTVTNMEKAMVGSDRQRIAAERKVQVGKDPDSILHALKACNLVRVHIPNFVFLDWSVTSKENMDA